MKEDLGVFFKDFGVKAKANGKTFLCLLDNFADALELGAEGRRIEATIQASDANDLSRGDEIAIAGTTYAIAQILPIEDGNFTDLILTES